MKAGNKKKGPEFGTDNQPMAAIYFYHYLEGSVVLDLRKL